MWMMPLHLHVNQKSDYDDDMTTRLGIFRQNTNLEFVLAVYNLGSVERLCNILHGFPLICDNY